MRAWILLAVVTGNSAALQSRFPSTAASELLVYRLPPGGAAGTAREEIWAPPLAQPRRPASAAGTYRGLGAPLPGRSAAHGRRPVQ